MIYVKQANAGPAAARNRGLKVAAGAFMTFPDADDLWHKNKLVRQMAHFDARPELDLCMAHMANFWTPDIIREFSQPSDIGPLKIQPGATQAIIVRRSLFDRIGPFDPNLKHRDAMERFSRAAAAEAVMETLPEVLVFRHIHRNNLSRHRGDDDRDELLRSMKSILDRRRGTSEVDD